MTSLERRKKGSPPKKKPLAKDRRKKSRFAREQKVRPSPESGSPPQTVQAVGGKKRGGELEPLALPSRIAGMASFEQGGEKGAHHPLKGAPKDSPRRGSDYVFPLEKKTPRFLTKEREGRKREKEHSFFQKKKKGKNLQRQNFCAKKERGRRSADAEKVLCRFSRAKRKKKPHKKKLRQGNAGHVRGEHKRRASLPLPAEREKLLIKKNSRYRG